MNDAAGIANDVRVSRFQAQRANRKPRIHTGQDREPALGTRCEFSQFVGARIDFVRCEYFVDHAHGRNILT